MIRVYRKKWGSDLLMDKLMGEEIITHFHAGKQNIFALGGEPWYGGLGLKDKIKVKQILPVLVPTLNFHWAFPCSLFVSK